MVRTVLMVSKIEVGLSSHVQHIVLSFLLCNSLTRPIPKLCMLCIQAEHSYHQELQAAILPDCPVIALHIAAAQVYTCM